MLLRSCSPSLAAVRHLRSLRPRLFFYPSYPQLEEGKKRADSRVSDTIVAILREYFSHSDRITVYICDDSEGQDRALSRQVLFNRWKKSLADIVDSYGLELYIEADDTTLYGGVLVHKNRDYGDLVQRELVEKLPSFILEKYR